MLGGQVRCQARCAASRLQHRGMSFRLRLHSGAVRSSGTELPIQCRVQGVCRMLFNLWMWRHGMRGGLRGDARFHADREAVRVPGGQVRCQTGCAASRLQHGCLSLRVRLHPREVCFTGIELPVQCCVQRVCRVLLNLWLRGHGVRSRLC